MTKSFRHKHSIRRLALSTAIVYFAALFFSHFHVSFVQHRHCVEHGEVVHVEDEHHASVHTHDHDDFQSNLEHDEEHGHPSHGCAALDFLFQPKLEAEDSIDIIDSQLFISELLIVERFEQIPIERLTLSPKTSPPLA